VPVAVPIDATPLVVEEAKPDAAVAKPVAKLDPKKVVPKPAATVVEDESGDETIGQRIKEAEIAYRAGEFEKAERIANFIITGNTGGKGQLAHAHVIHGLVMCSPAHNSQSNANTDARQIKDFPRLHAKLVSGCHDMHVELSDD
jgi:hypothetical protein